MVAVVAVMAEAATEAASGLVHEDVTLRVLSSLYILASQSEIALKMI